MKFWNAIKSCFSDKINTNEQTILIENDEILNNNEQITEVMNDYFLNAVEMLEIPKNLDIINDTTHAKNSVAKSILKFCSHPSIKTIKEQFNISNRFH